MKVFTELLREKAHFVSLPGASPEQITEAEEQLGTSFAQDFREYVAEFGAASFDEHELTGVCAPARLNVVRVTQRARMKNPFVPQGYYVIEEENIDGMLIWQSPHGSVYCTMATGQIEKIAENMTAYLNASGRNLAFEDE